MVDSIVSSVARKLGDLIMEEAELLGGVGKQVKWMEEELINIRCYLKDADYKRRRGDTRAENWLSRLREMAYRIEDAIDVFYLDLEFDRSQKYGYFFGKLIDTMTYFKSRKAMKVSDLHRLATELGDIRKQLEEIFKSKEKYQMTPQLQDQGARGSETVIVMPKRRAAYHDVDETEVVGLAADEKKILKLLCLEETPRRAVITIVGPGGIGKTTLARKIYNRQGHLSFLSFLPSIIFFPFRIVQFRMICSDSKKNFRNSINLLRGSELSRELQLSRFSPISLLQSCSRKKEGLSFL